MLPKMIKKTNDWNFKLLLILEQMPLTITECKKEINHNIDFVYNSVTLVFHIYIKCQPCQLAIKIKKKVSEIIICWTTISY